MSSKPDLSWLKGPFGHRSPASKGPSPMNISPKQASSPKASSSKRSSPNPFDMSSMKGFFDEFSEKEARRARETAKRARETAKRALIESGLQRATRSMTRKLGTTVVPVGALEETLAKIKEEKAAKTAEKRKKRMEVDEELAGMFSNASIHPSKKQRNKEVDELANLFSTKGKLGGASKKSGKSGKEVAIAIREAIVAKKEAALVKREAAVAKKESILRHKKSSRSMA